MHQILHKDLIEHWFIFQNNMLILIKTAEGLELPTSSSIPTLQTIFLRQHKLGPFNQAICYCAEMDQSRPLPVEFQATTLRKAFDILGKDWYVAAAKAFSIITWDKNHHYCGRCGHATQHQPDTFERLCPNCSLALYPRISPSIIVLIRKGSQLLLSRSHHFAPGVYGLIAGFVEVGESIEDAVHREVHEEVGLTIKNLNYFGSQSWPFPDSLMIGFTADYASGELLIDTKELETAGWYNYDNLPGGPSTSISIAYQLIQQFVQEQTVKKTAP